jgi:hypothetical protein
MDQNGLRIQHRLHRAEWHPRGSLALHLPRALVLRSLEGDLNTINTNLHYSIPNFARMVSTRRTDSLTILVDSVYSVSVCSYIELYLLAC